MDFIHIDYNLFKHKIKNKHTFILYFGGEWCKNCRAINHIIDNTAKFSNTTIYNLDSRVNNKEKEDDFRKCNTKDQLNQYKEFISLLNYKNDITVVIEDEDFNLIDTHIPAISVPALIVINNGEMVDLVIEEYEENEVTKDIEEEIKNKLLKLFKKLDNH